MSRHPEKRKGDRRSTLSGCDPRGGPTLTTKFRPVHQTRSISWQEDGRKIRAEIWTNLLLPGVVPHPNNETFQVLAIYDPLYAQPWLLATDLPIAALDVKALYQDRWPVEQIPLAAKHMLGAHRQFVFAQESIQRLPELALLAGSIQSFLAATLPVTATGFWDRNPRRTPGRLRRVLFGRLFPSSYPLAERIRKKGLGHSASTERNIGTSAQCCAHLARNHLRRSHISVDKVLPASSLNYFAWL